MDVMKKVPVREQAPDVRNKNFDEVCLGYNAEEAQEEATRCLNCKNARCVQGCPVSINIPEFIHNVKEGNFEEAYKVIGKSSALPAVCGRVCPQETQCEGQCIRGIKGEAVSIGKLERFVADWARENNVAPEMPTEKKGKKVAVIGSGPSGLTTALRKSALTARAPTVSITSVNAAISTRFNTGWCFFFFKASVIRSSHWDVSGQISSNCFGVGSESSSLCASARSAIIKAASNEMSVRSLMAVHLLP